MLRVQSLFRAGLPGGLDPKNVCVQAKAWGRERGVKPQDLSAREVHPLIAGRRTPIRRLKNKLGLRSYLDEGPLCEGTPHPARVVIALKQHMGATARPVVRVGDTVGVGQVGGRSGGG